MRLFVLAIFCLGIGAMSAAGAPARPNIIIMMADDMGYSDLGCYGSEIATPNLDGLASRGVRFTQFYNTGRCCPTRASLLTGLYSHQAGVGGMNEDRGADNPGYRGRLMDRCVTIGEVLGTASYRTIQTGKWHVGSQEAGWPVNRGFDRSFSCPEGGGFYFNVKAGRSVVRGDKVVYSGTQQPPPGWYATDAWTDEGLAYVKESVQDQKPFFWYLAYNAPHFPLQAKAADIAKYRGTYIIGWDKLREQRYQRMIELGLIDPNWPLSPRGDKIPAWDSLSDSQKDEQDLRMATYAAMIDCLDQNVGRIERTLKELGVYDNTLILFLQDNGGCAEGGILGQNKGTGPTGTAESDVWYGACWANVSNTPFRLYKHFVHEGGASTALVAHWPAGIATALKGRLVAEPGHVSDLMATCVDLAGATYPTSFKGNAVLPLEGTSLAPLLAGMPFARKNAIYFEHEGNRAVRQGDWKLVATKGAPWELYNLKQDRTELHNLAEQSPEKTQELSRMYDAWAERAMVNGAGGGKQNRKQKN